MRAWGLILLLAVPAAAEVPEHNPGLDGGCPQGFQFSRGPIACKQANCPPGAGRTYTYDCSCGEAWDKPFRTCYDPQRAGLATHCVPAGTPCEARAGGFDPVTGNCQSGFAMKADRSACEAQLPGRIECKVVDLEGQPVSGARVTFGEYSDPEGKKTVGQSQSGQSGPDGSIGFNPRSSGSPLVSFSIRPGGDFIARLEQRQPGQLGDCKLLVYSKAQIEARIKREIDDFLKDACVPQALRDQVRGIRFDFDSGVGNSQYDANGKVVKVAAGELSDWDGLRRTLVHELGHGLSDHLVDPSSWYVPFTDYPLSGKFVGGPHNNWEPNKDTALISGEELAFEEGAADFFAAVFFRAQGQTYQDDLQSGQTGRAFVVSHTPEQSVRTEGVVTSFLYDHYRRMAGDPKGAARAFGDFVRGATYSSRVQGGTPARTLRDFVVGSLRSGREDPPDDCTAKAGETEDLAGLADAYHLTGDGRFRMRLDQIRYDDTIRRLAQSLPLEQPADSLSLQDLLLQQGKPVDLPPGTARAFLEQFRPDFARTGRVTRVTFRRGGPVSFEVTPEQVVIVRQGRAHVLDGDVRTPNLQIDHVRTEYVVEVDGGQEKVTVLAGSVNVAEAGGAPVAVEAGQSVSRGSGGGLSPVQPASRMEPFWTPAASRAPALSPRLAFLAAGGLLGLLGIASLLAGGYRLLRG